MGNIKLHFAWTAGLVFTFVSFVPVPVSSQTLTVERVASGLSDPLFVTSAPGDPNRLYIVQRGGSIRVLNLLTGTLNAANFITVPDVSIGGSDERGLLGLAFHPNFQANRLFYVNHTDTSGNDTRLMRFTATDANLADPASGLLLMEIDQPQTNHNGGWIEFGSDGYLYVATGDGGGSNDSGPGHTADTGNAQDITGNLLGKVLRIDVDGDDFPADVNRNYAIPPSNPFVNANGDDEIFVYGLRNPWRCSFDRLNGDLYIADVGQGAREELNVLPGGGSGGENFGWRRREGTIATPNVGGSQPPGGVNPIYDYMRNNGPFGGRSITGGYVYRGPIAELRGHYFFADFISGNLWSLRFDGSNVASFNGNNFESFVRWNDGLVVDVGTINNIASFGEDSVGNLYIVEYSGQIFRIVGGTLPSTNGSGPGDVQVEVRNGDLRVRGLDDTDQCLLVSATGTAGQYMFSSFDDGSPVTTFNGQSTLLVGGVTGDLAFDLRSGEKRLVLSEMDQTEFLVPGDLRVKTSGTSSAIILLDTVRVDGRTDLRTKNGDDAILQTNCTFGGRIKINTGSGNDAVVAGLLGNGGVCESDLQFQMGSGADLLVCDVSTALTNVKIALGSGNDAVAVRSSAFGAASFNGNSGFDQLAESDSVIGSDTLRSIESESTNAGPILNLLQGSQSWLEVTMIFELLNLGD